VKRSRVPNGKEQVMKEVLNVNPAELEKKLAETPKPAKTVGPLDGPTASQAHHPSGLSSPPARQEPQPAAGKSAEETALEDQIAKARQSPPKELPRKMVRRKNKYGFSDGWKGITSEKLANGEFSHQATIARGNKRGVNTPENYEYNLGSYRTRAEAAYARTVGEKLLNHPKPVRNHVTVADLSPDRQQAVVDNVYALLDQQGAFSSPPAGLPGGGQNSQPPAAAKAKREGPKGDPER
jgi:hypothetical protein